MADEGIRTEGGNGTPDPNQVQVAMIAQYVKDLSFENPNAPASLQQMQDNKPDVKVNVSVNAKRVGDEGFEVSMKINTEAKVDDKPAFIAELDYAALWGIRNVPEENLQPLLLVECPRLMFPFARRILADAIRDGGFPPIMLDPIDFAGLYQQAEKKRDQKLN